MSRKLEYAHDAEHTQESEDTACVVQVVVVGVLLAEGERDVEGQYGDQIDHVERREQEDEYARRGEKAQQELDGEPADAHGLDYLEDRIVRFDDDVRCGWTGRMAFDLTVGGAIGRHDRANVKLGHGVERKRYGRDNDKEYGQKSNDLER